MSPSAGASSPRSDARDFDQEPHPSPFPLLPAAGLLASGTLSMQAGRFYQRRVPPHRRSIALRLAGTPVGGATPEVSADKGGGGRKAGDADAR
eukprot:CAMPEP_0181359942 /NCGR_PEP_ID=MMETSP1106-20121128/6380_1 /TAXON_ID=81844 /ORGANISM="Mantoniella antarctica, Strain SL-175" /LENGTH=92 /DNA_ID=CAMNT_0023473139 /DNA_START=358 /DNA_END=634 /DNA_ORIENTATION=-